MLFHKITLQNIVKTTDLQALVKRIAVQTIIKPIIYCQYRFRACLILLLKEPGLIRNWNISCRSLRKSEHPRTSPFYVFN